MKRWAWVVVLLYGLMLVVLTIPIATLAFLPKINLGELLKSYAAWQYWLWVIVMVLGQAALLAVPVRVANRRPVTRRSLLLPVVTAGFMMGGLALGAVYSLSEFVLRDEVSDWIWWSGLGLGVATWLAWTVIFYRMSRTAEPADLVSRQCRLLLKGSILELLIAVPTHIVARYRDYCCAGFMTFVGITLGISVMLFSFGPAVFFLYVGRWRRLHPEPTSPVTPAV